MRRRIGVVAVMAAATVVFGMAKPSPVKAATAALYLSPSSKSVEVGTTFTEVLYVGTDVAINSAEATITFPKNLLKVTSVSSSGTFTLWASQPSYSNSAGTITFTGGLPTPGYTGTSGKILTITFKSLATGTATVAVTNGAVLANDGLGTDILKSERTASIKISAVSTNTNTNTNSSNTNTGTTTSAPTFSSSVNPDQSSWYATRTIGASWSAGSGVQGYGVVFDTAPDTVVPMTVTTGSPNFTRDDVADGIWYLHVRAKYATGWSSTATYRFQIDATAPEPFSIMVEGDPVLTYFTTDATSGVDHYELSLDGGEFATAASPYTTPTLATGTHEVRVRAYDKAGNMTEASTTFEIVGYPQPVLIDLTPVLFGESPLILRGYSNPQDSIRLTIDGIDYGPYAVADYVDTNPPSATPEGKVAWRIEVKPNVSAGEHTITLTAIAADGTESDVTPPVTFKIVTNSIQLFGFIIPTVVVINVLVLVVLLLLAAAVYYAIRYHRLRRHVKRGTERPNILKPAKGRIHFFRHKERS